MIIEMRSDSLVDSHNHIQAKEYDTLVVPNNLTGCARISDGGHLKAQLIDDFDLRNRFSAAKSVEKNEDKKNMVAGRYIFIAPAIANIGGGQLYLSTKSQWLEENGWEVKIIFIADGPVQLPALKKYKEGWSEDLQYRFVSFTKKERHAAALKMLGPNPIPSRVVIESYSFETALWGEYMAKIAGGQHLCYLINETHRPITPTMRSFLQFKLSQHLLYGITLGNIPSILPEANQVDTYLGATGCSLLNAPDIDDERLKDINPSHFTILSITRLEKPYVENMFREITKFSESCPQPVDFILVGDTPDNELRTRLFALLNNAPNLKLFFWGYTYPVPRRLYEQSDVFIGCAGSAQTAYKQNLPAITIDAHDYSAIGILGETTMNRLYRNYDEPPVAARELLRVIFDQKEQRRSLRQGLPQIEEKADFSRHEAILNMPVAKAYYPVDKVKNTFLFDLIYNSIKLFGGRATLAKIKSLKQKLFPNM